MTIISHKFRFIFLKTRKTAGTSIELWLSRRLGRRDIIATSFDSEPLNKPFLSTPNVTSRFPRWERKLKRKLRHFGWRPFEFTEHMKARDVRVLVGENIWNAYTKVAVERNPWDRIISLWRFRRTFYNKSYSLEEFLDAIEDGQEPNWSNWEIYTIDDVLAVDKMIFYSDIGTMIPDHFRMMGMRVDHDLPYRKTGFRLASDRTEDLSPAVVRRVGRLFAKEIQFFNFFHPSDG